jgi:hypothetical protein
MRQAAALLGLLALSLHGVACENAGIDRIAALDATGTVTGMIFVDANASRAMDAGDPGAGSLDVALVLAGTSDTVATATTGADGRFVFPEVPVGRYTLALPLAVLADSFRVVYRDPPGEAVADGLGTQLPPAIPQTVARNDTATVVIGIGHPRVPVAEARTAPAGARLFVRGVALTRIDPFGDATLHLRGPDAAIRAIQVRPGTLVIGDTVHVLGTVSSHWGEPVVSDARVFVMAAGTPPAPRPVSPGVAMTADGGALDAELVEITAVIVGDTSRVGNRFRIVADDPDAPVETMIHPDGTYDFTRFGRGAVLDITGVLVPDSASGSWRVWPRSGADVVVVTPAPPPDDD